MKALFRWVGVALIAGGLGLAGAADASGVKAKMSLDPVTGTVTSWTGALSGDGSIFSWGGSHQQPSTVPVNLYVGQPVVNVSNDGRYFVLNDGSLFDANFFAPVAGLSSVQAVIENGQFVGSAPGSALPDWAVTATGKIYSFVNSGMIGGATIAGGWGMSGVGVTNVVPRPNLVAAYGPAMGSSWAWAVGSNGALYSAQSTYNSAPPGISNVATAVSGFTNVQSVADVGGTNVVVVRADGTVWAAGPDFYTNGGYYSSMNGIVPPGGVSPTATGPVGLSGVVVTPVQIPGLANVTSLAVGGSSSMNGSNIAVYAVTATGQVWAWGVDYSGQLGSNQNTANGFASFPQLIPGLTNVTQLATTADASVLALTFDGKVWGWGVNYDGQLGDGSNIDHAAPAQISGLSGVTSVSITAKAGFGAHAVASTSDGGVWTWGSNAHGELGDGTRVSKNSPVRVLGQSGVGSLTLNPANIDVLVNGVSVRNSMWNGFSFGSQAVGSTSAAQTMTFSNIGMNAWTGFAATTSIGDFGRSTTCGSVLLPGASCTMSYTFAPTAAGARTAPLFGGVSLGNSSLNGDGALLTGTGSGPQVVFPTTFDFGNQTTGVAGTRTVSMFNAGNATLNVGVVSISGVNAAQFGISNNACGATLAAGASCNLTLSFTPVAGANNATLTIAASSNYPAVSMLMSGTGATATATRGDFNFDGKADIFFRDLTTGQNVFWFMNGATLTSGVFTSSAASAWSAVGVSDFNGDGKSDLLWNNASTGQNVLWTMNSQNILSATALSSVYPSWSVAGVGDFDGNGQSGDILWKDASTGQAAVWLTNAGSFVSGGLVGSVAQGWSVAGVGDFNGDGKSDVLLRNAATGANVIWFMNGTSILQAAAVTTVTGTWSIKGVADFDGNGKADIYWLDASGNTAIWLMNGASIASSGLSNFVGTAWQPVQFADFNGDGKSDIMWRNASGNNTIWFMNGLTLTSYVATTSAAANWTVIGK